MQNGCSKRVLISILFCVVRPNYHLIYFFLHLKYQPINSASNQTVTISKKKNLKSNTKNKRFNGSFLWHILHLILPLIYAKCIKKYGVRNCYWSGLVNAAHVFQFRYYSLVKHKENHIFSVRPLLCHHSDEELLIFIEQLHFEACHHAFR